METNREIIQLSFGQAGINIGDALWKLYCKEHEIARTGLALQEGPTGDYSRIFSHSHCDKYVPRALFADSDTESLDIIRRGPTRFLYHPDSLINGWQGDMYSNCARGAFGAADEFYSKVREQLRKLVEVCDFPEGFMIFRSMVGGMGSGFPSKFLRDLKEEYPQLPIIDFGLLPMQRVSDICVQHLNAIYAATESQKYADCTIFMDNEGLFDICEEKLQNLYPSFSNINALIAQAISTITCSMRFDGPMRINLSDIARNLPITSYARETSNQDGQASNFANKFLLMTYAPLSANVDNNFSAGELINQALSPQNCLAKVNGIGHRYLTLGVFCRGNIASSEIFEAIDGIKKSKKYHFEIPSGKIFALARKPPVLLKEDMIAPRDLAICVLCNQRAIVKRLVPSSADFALKSSTENFALKSSTEDFYYHQYELDGLKKIAFDLKAGEIISEILKLGD